MQTQTELKTYHNNHPETDLRTEVFQMEIHAYIETMVNLHVETLPCYKPIVDTIWVSFLFQIYYNLLI